MSMPPLPTRLDSVVLYVKDRLSAQTWYRSHLGFVTEFSDPGSGTAVLRVGHVDSLTLWEVEAHEVIPRAGIAAPFPVFETHDADALREELLKGGVIVSPMREFPGTRSFSFWDPDGNRLGAFQLIQGPDGPQAGTALLGPD